MGQANSVPDTLLEPDQAVHNSIVQNQQHRERADQKDFPGTHRYPQLHETLILLHNAPNTALCWPPGQNIHCEPDVPAIGPVAQSSLCVPRSP